MRWKRDGKNKFEAFRLKVSQLKRHFDPQKRMKVAKFNDPLIVFGLIVIIFLNEIKIESMDFRKNSDDDDDDDDDDGGGGGGGDGMRKKYTQV
ncbi:hypothetical protein QR98_0033620 [Sarcoptes scabiei]|uniref:Uncharacterized protein n=1 Tax=Sarcoptes scabiei TaxID=52283 RepID=A0A132A1R8_SARSC|nr:hypothetical protein QR98_0033620 [Sarcoptes scabiei]